MNPEAAMSTLQSLRRVPWTCKWGRFGGPVPSAEPLPPGFVFWVCARPQEHQGVVRLLTRGTCERCPEWEACDEGSDPYQ